MMNCPTCGHENPDRAKFCLECDAAISRRSASCNAEVPAAAKPRAPVSLTRAITRPKASGDEATRERELHEAHRLFTEMGASIRAGEIAKNFAR
jgi:Double zinc ribbon